MSSSWYGAIGTPVAADEIEAEVRVLEGVLANFERIDQFVALAHVQAAIDILRRSFGRQHHHDND